MKNTKTIFLFIIACTTLGTHVPIVAIFLIFVPIAALASRRQQNTNQNRIEWIKNFRLI